MRHNEASVNDNLRGNDRSTIVHPGDSIWGQPGSKTVTSGDKREKVVGGDTILWV